MYKDICKGFVGHKRPERIVTAFSPLANENRRRGKKEKTNEKADEESCREQDIQARMKTRVCNSIIN